MSFTAKPDIRIILTSLDARLSVAWREYCSCYDFVEFHDGSILDLEVDAVVSPANSFGFMNGGIDLLYRNQYGEHIENALRIRIDEDFRGELTVGCATALQLYDQKSNWLIASPTMRVPDMLDNKTINPYLSARAALICAYDELDVPSIAFPGLGTGVGCVAPEVCAFQVREAIAAVLGPRKPPATWIDASQKHYFLSSLGVMLPDR